MGAPRPDLRRILHPLGPVVVFAASNFPFAFSVAGGDTASALAAGCPVVVKAHPGHPELSAATVEQSSSGPGRGRGTRRAVFALVYGTEAGVAALRAPEVKAARSPDRSPAAGPCSTSRARPEPIPFYGELGSVNPVFVTESRGGERAERSPEFVASFTLGAGQFCTKPGVLLVPRDSAVVERLAEAELPGPAPLLNDRIQEGYVETLRSWRPSPRCRCSDGRRRLPTRPARRC